MHRQLPTRCQGLRIRPSRHQASAIRAALRSASFQSHHAPILLHLGQVFETDVDTKNPHNLFDVIADRR